MITKKMKVIEAIAMFRLDPIKLGVDKEDLYDEVEFSSLSVADDYIILTLETNKEIYVHKIPRLTVDQLKLIESTAHAIVYGDKEDREILKVADKIIKQWKEEHNRGNS
jgi:hypothetical protein